MRYLVIENHPADSEIPPVEAMRLIGASLSRGKADHVGQFGTGFPFSLALLARTWAAGGEYMMIKHLRICLGKDVYTFGMDLIESIGHNEIWMQKQGGSRFPLNISSEFGAIDWADVSMAAREFISNGDDWNRGCPSKVEIIDIPDGKKFKYAKDGYVRVFMPLDDDGNIEEYFLNIHRYFLNRRPSYDPSAVVIDKKEAGPSRIYRKGVFVGEFGHDETDRGLFDYNINDIPINECRIVSEGDARTYCARALRNQGSKSQISKYFDKVVLDEGEYWERRFFSWDVDPQYSSDEIKAKYRGAIEVAMGDRVACAGSTVKGMVESRGHRAVVLDSSMLEIVKKSGGTTDSDVLNYNDLNGRKVKEPTDIMRRRLAEIWDAIDRVGMTNDKACPYIKSYDQITESKGASEGYYYHDDCVYVRSDHENDHGFHLKHIILHELVHHITGAKDYSADYQEYLCKLGLKWAIDGGMMAS